MSAKFAESTKTPVVNSRMEVERILKKYGANSIGYGEVTKDGRTQYAVMFQCHERHVRMLVPMPDPKRLGQTAYEKEERRRWRVLVLVLKAKLEAVQSGVSVFEDEFLAHIILPDNQTVSQWIRPQLTAAYGTGKMPALLGFEL